MTMDDEETKLLERLDRQRDLRLWLAIGAGVVLVLAVFVLPRLRHPCTRATTEICHDLLVSCGRLKEAMEDALPPREWCEQFLVIEHRSKAQDEVIARYPGVELSKSELEAIRQSHAEDWP